MAPIQNPSQQCGGNNSNGTGRGQGQNRGQGGPLAKITIIDMIMQTEAQGKELLEAILMDNRETEIHNFMARITQIDLGEIKMVKAGDTITIVMMVKDSEVAVGVDTLTITEASKTITVA